ncbi:MAG: HEPN domain-containing protein [Desulfobacterales bacterium]|nr:HEPN domain-containing protein [Desulfobacterales bacterium]
MLDQNERINYWFDLAAYDLETAKVMLDGERYLYVGFMCHQVVEKALKGYFVSVSLDQPPYSHNLSILAKKSDIYSLLNESQLDLLDTLEPLNIQARYPTSKDKVLKSLTMERCRGVIKETEALFKWIKARL